MSLPATSYPHLAVTAERVPVLAGTRLRVIDLVSLYRAYGWSPEELHLQLPHVPLSHIHSALAYYWDHVDELDAALREQLERVDGQRRAVRLEQDELVEVLRGRAKRSWP